ncbi:hypothetical protein EJ05DRAFT_476630 [Pseudovirgaria hyperparasitica]|uniref:Uncharacterized protein n=1 Tax=Pseudovirgaria hyperparasitica TaxID=470096 RepID=A0A6A6W5A8_9PEZI|nr:uncharacterized protein EJ05DRAFT_476630 [Pseudovirgaria hyperparasitica]KAF2757359.1 hypothetical protein EJ05DRAFT_476630 [Pseudovirgaria hyperparasitica]
MSITGDPAIEQQLRDEVDRIIMSPYPVSLKKLHNLVTRVDTETLQIWAYNNPCQLSRLAIAVSDALSLWPFALDLLQRLLHAASFLQTFLRQHSSFLDAFVQKAVFSAPDFDRYSHICILLLSEILPPTIALPASAHDFFVQVFHNLASSPTFENLRRAHTLTRGACFSLPALLPANLVTQFERNVKRILQMKKPPTPENRRFDLFAVDLLCLLSRNECTTSNSEKTIATMLFHGANALKQIDLINSNVIDACKGDSSSTADSIARVQAARRVIATIGEERTKDWSAQRTQNSDQILSKLLQYVAKPTLGASLQGEAIAYISCLVDADHLPAEITRQFRDLFRNLMISLEISFSWLTQALTRYSKLLDDISITALMSSLLVTSTKPSNSVHLLRARSIAKVIADSLPHSSAFSDSIVSTLGSGKVHKELREFLEVLPDTGSSIPEAVSHCSSAMNNLQRSTAISVSTMLLRGRLYHFKDNADARSSVWSELLRMQHRLENIHFPCTHAKMAQQSQKSLLCIIEQECTQLNLEDEDWRSKIARELELHNSSQQKNMLQTIAQICRDLEQRCELSEQPLRNEQAHSKELADKCNALEFRLKELSTEVNDKTFVVSGLESELQDVEAVVRDLASENNTLSGTIEAIQNELKKAEAGHTNLLTAQEALDAEVTDLRVTVSSKADLVQEQRTEIVNLKEKISEDNSVLEILRADFSEKLEAMATLEAELEKSREKLQHTIDCCAHKDKEILVIKGREQIISAELGHARSSLDEVSAEADKLREQLADQDRLSKEANAQATAELRCKELEYEEHLDDIQCRLDQETSEFNHAKSKFEEERRNLAEEIEQHSSEIENLRLHIVELDQTCASKDAEIFQYKAWQQQLVSMMPGVKGGPGADVLVEQKAKHPKRAARSTPIKAPRTSTTAPDVSQLTDMNTSFGSSSSKDGPTPKRAKPRKSFRVPLIRRQNPNTPRARRSLLNVTRQCEVDEDSAEGSPSRTPPSVSVNIITQPGRLSTIPLRQALFDVSTGRGNMSPVRAALRPSDDLFKSNMSQNSGKQLRKMLPVMEITSFDTSNVFTSTPLTPRLGRNNAMNEVGEQQDNETVDVDEL